MKDVGTLRLTVAFLLGMVVALLMVSVATIYVALDIAEQHESPRIIPEAASDGG